VTEKKPYFIKSSHLIFSLAQNQYFGTLNKYSRTSHNSANLLNNLYALHESKNIFTNFYKQYSQLPCKGERHRHLVFLWCGLFDLPIYNHAKEQINWMDFDFRKNWRRDFLIRNDQLKIFLRAQQLPLPDEVFNNDLDNTSSHLALGKTRFSNFRKLICDVLPVLEKNKIDLYNTTELSYSDLNTRNAEIEKLTFQIDAIQTLVCELKKFIVSISLTNLKIEIPNNLYFIQQRQKLLSNFDINYNKISSYSEKREKSKPNTANGITTSPSEKNYFKQNQAGSWDVAFNGEIVQGLKPLKGMVAIQYLIKHQGKIIDSLSIAKFIGNPPSTTQNLEATVVNLSKLDSFKGFNEEADETALSQYKKEIKKMEEKISSQNLSVNEKEKLKADRQLIQNIITNSKNRKIVQKGSPEYKEQEKTRKNINDTILELETTFPQFAFHLKNCIKTGSQTSYNPSKPINWDVFT